MPLPQPPPPKTFCEFFAGIGLVREGLHESGWSCVYANDIDPKKHEIYQAHFRDKEEHFHLGDVWNTDEVVSRIQGRPFLATASFPCIDLSLAGHWQGINGKHSSTFFAFAKALEVLEQRSPKIILVENVTGFLASRGGDDLKAAALSLAELGYWLDAFVLDAKFFVRQSRPRLFLVGVHESTDPPNAVRQSADKWIDEYWTRIAGRSRELCPPRLLKQFESTDLPTGWIAFDLPLPRMTRKRLASYIDLDDDQEWWDEPAVEKHYHMMSDLHRRQVDNLLAEGGFFVGTIYRRKRYGKTRAEVRFDGIAGCLRTPKGGSAKQIVIVIDNSNLKMRWMHPREYARLQGADTFPLVGTTNQQLFGFGDAVCVPVIRYIDEHVLTPVFESVVEPSAKIHA